VIVAGVEEASIAIEEGRLAALKCARSLKASFCRTGG